MWHTQKIKELNLNSGNAPAIKWEETRSETKKGSQLIAHDDC